jgi:hypothetical protein
MLATYLDGCQRSVMLPIRRLARCLAAGAMIRYIDYSTCVEQHQSCMFLVEMILITRLPDYGNR